MARIGAILTIAALLVPHTSAADCAQGSCAEDQDVTSLLQVGKVVTAGDERDYPFSNEMGAQAPIANEVAESLNPAENMDELADDIPQELEKARIIHDDVEDQDTEDVLGRSVLPPPVGHGSMEDNPSVVDWKAETKAMPGQPGGPVTKAFDTSVARGVNNNHYMADVDHDIELEDNSERGTRNMAHDIMADQDATVDSLQNDEEKVLGTLANSDNVAKQAIHEVANAREDYGETAIKKAQTQDAALAGQYVGRRIAAENAQDHLEDVVHARTTAALKRTRDEMHDARDVARAEGITAADDYQAGEMAEGRAYVAHKRKENTAVQRHSARDANVLRTSIEGAEGIKNHMLKEDANLKAGRYHRWQRRDQDDIAGAVVEGAPQVERDIVADAVTAPLVDPDWHTGLEFGAAH